MNSLLAVGIFIAITMISDRLDRVLAIADRLLSEGQYSEAITEYKRYIFFNENREESAIAYAYYKMGLAFRIQGQGTDAIEMIIRAIQSTSDENVREEYRIVLGITLIGQKQYSQADFLLLKVEMFSPYEKARKRAAFFRGICAIYTSQWEVAREAFLVFFSGEDSEINAIGRRIDELIDRAKRIHHKSPRLAKTLSSIIPGLGQIYSGDLFGGLNAFALNLATGYLCINGIVKKQFMDAIFNSFFLFERFYTGNRKNAIEAANRKNNSLNQRLALEIETMIKGKI